MALPGGLPPYPVWWEDRAPKRLPKRSPGKPAS
jgi:hypothetical protein